MNARRQEMAAQSKERVLLEMHLPTFHRGYECARAGFFEQHKEYPEEVKPYNDETFLADFKDICQEWLQDRDEDLLQYAVGNLLGYLSVRLIPQGETSGVLHVTIDGSGVTASATCSECDKPLYFP